MKFLSYGHQDITEEDINAVVAVLKSDYLTQGPAVEEFETAIELVCKTKFATICSNGTAALHLAMLAADVRGNDIVIAPAVTFVASANCAKYVGAEVLFADIDENTACISPVSCEKILKKVQALIIN